MPEDSLVRAMALMRVFAGNLEVAAAFLMLRFGRVESAFRINAWLGIIGPATFLLVSSLGLAGMVGQIPPLKVVLLLGAVVLILISAEL
ncbi:MAG: hypothetical protein PWP58_1595 [Bacillota bacterium]|nr:hypothetical protein [Bacillota bacterium]MDK2785182.1 hypothetical protein [Bacillota bacterium]MDK2883259.1 hypothetical protein [Bacillota bacterium]